MMRTRLTLQPGSNGAKKLTERYGSRLVCVRYRYDRERKRRLKTVELIEEDVPWVVPTEVDHYLVKIAYEEGVLREKVKAAGAEWVRERRLMARDRADRPPPLARGPRGRLDIERLDIYR